MDEFTTHCSELLAPLGSVRVRRMFGGRGLYLDELFIALIADEQFFLKTDALTRPQFEAAGCQPFRYLRQGEWQSIGYYAPPEEALESPALMQPWARLALDAALRARAAKAPTAGARTGAVKPKPARLAGKPPRAGQ